MLKLIKQFITDNAFRLQQQLSQLEQNVATETQALADGKMANPVQVRLSAQTSAVAASITTKQVGLCEAGANFSFALAPPSDGQPGFAWLVKRNAANTVTARPSGMVNSAARTINNAASKVYGGGLIGVFTLYYDGANWWTTN